MDRKEWLESRRKVLTASDAAAVLGLNPWKPPISVYLEKLHPEMVDEVGYQELLDFGLDVEPALARAYERKTGLSVERPGFELAYHPKYPEIGCTIDGISRDPRKLVQLKWETQYSDKFGSPGSDEVPDAYLIQCGIEMSVWGCDLEDVATMHAGPPLLIFPLHRDFELESTLIDRLREWFDRHIVRGIEPDIDSSHEWSDYLQKKYPRDRGKLLSVEDDETLKMISELKDATARIKEATEEADTIKNRLRAIIQDASGLVCPDRTRVMWTPVKESVVPSFTRKAYRKFEIKERK